MASSKNSQLVVALLCLVGAGVVWWSMQRPSPGAGADNEAARRAQDASGVSAASPPPAVPGIGAALRSSISPGEAVAELEKRFRDLEGVEDADEARRLLKELRTWLKSLPPDTAAEIVARFIRGGADTPLPLEFDIGQAGFLSSPPSFRVALLDFLGWLHPTRAVDLGKEVLESPTSADEWAISLRNVGRLRNTGPDREYLRTKTEELIKNPAWQESPSIGYLNSFDVLVHARAAESTPLLSGLVQRKDRRDLAHASFLTLTRLVQNETADVLNRLKGDRALHASRPEMVAQQFAYADFRDPAQTSVVRAWLLDGARTPTELRSFAAIFPNGNQMISNNLLTTEPQLSGADLAAQERAALQQVIQWQSDPDFAALQPHLRTIDQRLRRMVPE